MKFIRVVAFFSGLVVLGIEITAFRIVAPYFGNSIFITTNLLGVILAGLAAGYWLGGNTADRVKRARPLFLLMLVTACVCALIPFVAPSILTLLRDQLSSVDWKLIVLSLAGCIVLFFIPFVMLGMVSPWLVRLAITQHDTRGKSTGSIYAWSTLGSLLGTFLPTLLLVPLIGTKRTILSLSVVLAIVAIVGLRKVRWAPVAIVILAAVLGIRPRFADGSSVIAERESALEYLRVVQDRGEAVHLEQDEGLGIHSVYDPGTVDTGLVFDWLSFAPELQVHNKDQTLSVAVLGLAGGTVARQLDYYYGSIVQTIGVELDPETLALAREHFGLDAIATLTAVAGDARVWLSTQQDTYDVIIVDAFRQLYIPPHLSTKEFFEMVAKHLNPGGLVAVNLNVVGRDSFVEKSLATTIASSFTSTAKLSVPNSYNVVFYASDESVQKPNPENYSGQRKTVAKSIENALTTVLPEPGVDPATDDRPLVESWYDLMVGQEYF